MLDVEADIFHPHVLEVVTERFIIHPGLNGKTISEKQKQIRNKFQYVQCIYIVSSDFAFSKAFLNKNLYQVFSHC